MKIISVPDFLTVIQGPLKGEVSKNLASGKMKRILKENNFQL